MMHCRLSCVKLMCLTKASAEKCLLSRRNVRSVLEGAAVSKERFCLLLRRFLASRFPFCGLIGTNAWFLLFVCVLPLRGACLGSSG